MRKTWSRWLEDADKYVLGHIYALENQTVNDLFAQYEIAYHNMRIALEATAARYSIGETWSYTDAQAQQRTETLVQQIVAEMKALSGRSADIALRAAAESYAATYAGKAWMADMVSGGAVNVPLLPAEAIRATILAPYKGSTFVERFKGNDDEFQTRIRRSLVQSQIEGESIYLAQKRLANELGLNISRRTQVAKQANRAAFNRTQMITRTEIIRASSMGTLAVYERNKDVVKGWTWQASRDDRVCDECADEDGKDHLLSDNYAPPPLHPSCRCSQLPYFGDRDLDDIVRGDVPSFKEWAAIKGIDQSRFGQVYSLKAAAPPKAKKA